MAVDLSRGDEHRVVKAVTRRPGLQVWHRRAGLDGDLGIDGKDAVSITRREIADPLAVPLHPLLVRLFAVRAVARLLSRQLLELVEGIRAERLTANQLGLRSRRPPR